MYVCSCTAGIVLHLPPTPPLQLNVTDEVDGTETRCPWLSAASIAESEPHITSLSVTGRTNGVKGRSAGARSSSQPIGGSACTQGTTRKVRPTDSRSGDL